jgi:hypothetical protein
MRQARALRSLAACVGGLWLTAAQAGLVIAHPSVDLNAEEIRLVFLGEKQLVGQLRLVPVDNLAARARFLEKVLQTDARKYEARWLRKAFREGLTAPSAKGSDAEVLSFVRSTPGAVGYVETATPGVKVLEGY